MKSQTDKFWMNRAVELARKGIGTTSPNPRVGAVLVRSGRAVGDGYHVLAGRDHAEVIALKKAGSRARGATLYVTLEPCAHFGRTPPCLDAVIRSGVKRVVIGETDPDPKTRGKSLTALRKAGIAVTVGVLAEEVRGLNLPFHKWIAHKLPYVTIKAAQTLDGKIASRTGDSKWISSPASRGLAQNLRAAADAVLVGIGTVQADDPRLSVRSKRPKYPYKVILDGKLSIPASARLFSTAGRTILAATSAAPAARKKQLSSKAEVLVLPSRRGRVDLKALLKALAARGILHLLVEGGGEVIADFVAQGLADDIYLFVAPRILGGRDAISSVAGEGAAKLSGAVPVKDLTVLSIASDFLFYGRF